MRRQSTLDEIGRRVNGLCSDFSYYIHKFDSSNRFTGPSLYFHFRTLDRLKECGTLATAFQDNLLFEYLYATLTAWGLHRMGPKGAKLVDFETFRSSLRNQKSEIENLEHLRLTRLSEADVDVVAGSLWEILASLRISKAETKLIANSKALHHLVPQLMPPIDRAYTFRFFGIFYGRPNISREEQIFREIYRQFHRIGSRSEVKEAIQKHLGHGFHTSETKVIDNAIVGYVLTCLPEKHGSIESTKVF